MNFIADLHVHSKYSRATAKNLDLENLYIAAQLKGINVVGTGDFTHPGWFDELKNKLEPAEEGLFRLRPDISKICDEKIPLSCRGKVRFMLVSEISNIYKKNEKTRKNHNLVFAPDMESAALFNERLDKIGNIKSDGRPILGLDARDLLEILLETTKEGFLVPAHIWTPWFSMLGSKSGFDSVRECFEDLTDYIFAVETGLSSDPLMNWRVKCLDGLTLISNSDAHSPMKLGREANLFNTDLSYSSIKKAIKKADPETFLGTFEFYPEEGKYHIDGHRKCNVSMVPRETKKCNGICPVCKKPLTIGVLNRVEELAQRPEGEKPEKAINYHHLIPLDDVLSEILKVGPKSKKVTRAYQGLLEKLGSEFHILHTAERETIDTAGIPLLGEAIIRMRENRVNFSPGFDGEFGKVSIFKEGEREEYMGLKGLFSQFDKKKKEKPLKKKTKEKQVSDPVKIKKKKVIKEKKIELNPKQISVVNYPEGPVLIKAGPGTGKTRTITHRISKLIQNGLSPERILSVTFTNKAATEMQERLALMLGKDNKIPVVGTFHGVCLSILKKIYPDRNIMVIDDELRNDVLKDAVIVCKKNNKTEEDPSFKDILNSIVKAKQQLIDDSGPLHTVGNGINTAFLSSVYKQYQKILKNHDFFDYEDLIFKVINCLKKDNLINNHFREAYSHIFVDEFQDINKGQYCLIKALSDKDANICVIGDPNQSIYGFRGSDIRFFDQFQKDFPKTTAFSLLKNYRSCETILQSSFQLIDNSRCINHHSEPVYSDIKGPKTIHILKNSTEKAEAVVIGKTIENMMGGTGFHSMDFDKTDHRFENDELGFSDFAVLFRTHDQGTVLYDILEKAGIPCRFVNKASVLGKKRVKEIVSLLKIIEERGCFYDIEQCKNMIKPSISASVFKTFKLWSYEKNFNLNKAIQTACRLPIPVLNPSQQKKLYAFLKTLLDIKTRLSGMSIPSKLDMIQKEIILQSSSDEDALFRDAMLLLKNSFHEIGSDSASFFSTLALQKDTDIFDKKTEKVSLMTMHASKGLEFKVVFIAGCENGYIPSARSEKEDEKNIEEERRLFYVAMTRAKKHLFFTWSTKRNIYGKTVQRELSPFIEDIDDTLKKVSASLFKRKQQQLSLF